MRLYESFARICVIIEWIGDLRQTGIIIEFPLPNIFHSREMWWTAPYTKELFLNHYIGQNYTNIVILNIRPKNSQSSKLTDRILVLLRVRGKFLVAAKTWHSIYNPILVCYRQQRMMTSHCRLHRHSLPSFPMPQHPLEYRLLVLEMTNGTCCHAAMVYVEINEWTSIASFQNL